MSLHDLRFVFVLALLGCGQVESVPDGSSGERAAPADPPVASPAPAETPLPAVRRTGYVNMTSAGGVLYAHADFPLSGPPIVNRKREGCQLSPGSFESVPSESAGQIVIEVPGRIGPTTATLTFDPKAKSYESTTLAADGKDERVEKANAPFRIHAAGAGIPAFDVDVASAFDAQLIDPPEETPISSTSGDLVVRWSDGGNEAVLVSLQILDNTISCQFEPGAGKGVIPSALVQQAIAMKPKDSCVGICASIQLTSFRSSKVAAGDYDIFVSHALTSLHALHLE